MVLVYPTLKLDFILSNFLAVVPDLVLYNNGISFLIIKAALVQPILKYAALMHPFLALHLYMILYSFGNSLP